MKQLTPSQMITRSFWCGYLFYMFMNQAVMDWVGQDEFIAIAENNWIDTHWLMWTVFCAAIWWIYDKLQNSVKGLN